MKTAISFFSLAVIFLTSLTGSAQNPDRWAQWHWLLGTWQGESDGAPGQGTGTFSLQPDLDGFVLVRKSHTDFPATGQRPAFSHDDLMVVTSGSGDRPVRAAYYDNEGHTIEYGVTVADSTIVMTSVREENAPVFRLTYTDLGSKRIGVRFEMSMDGKAYRTYTEGTCRRVKGP